MLLANRYVGCLLTGSVVEDGTKRKREKGWEGLGMKVRGGGGEPTTSAFPAKASNPLPPRPKMSKMSNARRPVPAGAPACELTEVAVILACSKQTMHVLRYDALILDKVKRAVRII